MKRNSAFSIKISIFLIVCFFFLTISLLSTEKVFAVEFAGGSGTEVDPYIITTAEQLDAVRNNLAANYKLGADIDLSAYENWVPIGDTFTGGLDGGIYSISNLTINQPEGPPIGLFESTGNAKIKNIKLIDVNIIGKDCVAGLTGYAWGSTAIDNCFVTGSVTATGDGVGGDSGKECSTHDKLFDDWYCKWRG